MEQILIVSPIVISFLTGYFYLSLKNKTGYAFRFIPLIIVSVSIRSLYLIVNYYKVLFGSTDENPISPPLTLFTIIAAYLFIKELMNKGKRSKLFVTLFLTPPILLFVLYIVIVVSPEMKEQLQYINYWLKNLAVFFSVIFFTINLYKDYKKSDVCNNERRVIISTLMLFFAIFLLYIVTFANITTTKYIWFIPQYVLHILEIISSLIFYSFCFSEYRLSLIEDKRRRLEGFYSLLNHQSHEAKHNVRYNTSLQIESLQHYLEVEPHEELHARPNKEAEKEQYKTAHLQDEELTVYKDKVEEYFDNNSEKLLDSDFSLNLLAEEINVSRYYLSQTFSVKMKTSFSDYLNEVRIEKACKIIANNADISITKLSEQVGYRSRTSFYSHFKRVKGCTPKEYIMKREKQ